MTEPNDEPMLDRGRVGVGTLLWVAGVCITAAIGWNDVKLAAAAQEKRIGQLERESGKIDKLTMVICLDTPERVARCRALGLLQ